MTKEEFLDGFLEDRNGYEICCDTLEQRRQAIDILRAYPPLDQADTTYAADKYAAERWPALFYSRKDGFALRGGIEYTIPFETFLEIMSEDSVDEPLPFGAALEDLL